MAMIFDTHAHYDDRAFAEDRREVLLGLKEHGIGYVVDAGASLRSLPRILGMTDEYSFLYMAAGLHPCEVYGCGDNTGEVLMHKDWKTFAGEKAGKTGSHERIFELTESYDGNQIIDADWTAGESEMKLLRAFMEEPKVVAVGEIGLDYHYEDTRKDLQKEWFSAQINLAKEFCKPINVHSRDAAQDTLDMIRAESARDVGGIIHCFSYGKEMAREYLDLGFMIGMGGVVTFKNSKKAKEVVEYMPLDRLVLETDCPYLAPTPHRGKRNDSSMLNLVVETIAQIKGVPVQKVIEITEQNAKEVYRIQ